MDWSKEVVAAKWRLDEQKGSVELPPSPIHILAPGHLSPPPQSACIVNRILFRDYVDPTKRRDGSQEDAAPLPSSRPPLSAVSSTIVSQSADALELIICNMSKKYLIDSRDYGNIPAPGKS